MLKLVLVYHRYRIVLVYQQLDHRLQRHLLLQRNMLILQRELQVLLKSHQLLRHRHNVVRHQRHQQLN